MKPLASATHTSRPTNQQVRAWMQQRQADHTPPPSLEEVRRQLGWELVDAAREQLAQCKR